MNTEVRRLLLLGPQARYCARRFELDAGPFDEQKLALVGGWTHFVARDWWSEMLAWDGRKGNPLLTLVVPMAAVQAVDAAHPIDGRHGACGRCAYRSMATMLPTPGTVRLVRWQGSTATSQVLDLPRGWLFGPGGSK